MNIARIVQKETRLGYLPVTMGTKVLLEDGSAIGGVQEINISGKLDDLWRGELKLIIDPQGLRFLIDKVSFLVRGSRMMDEEKLDAIAEVVAGDYRFAAPIMDAIRLAEKEDVAPAPRKWTAGAPAWQAAEFMAFTPRYTDRLRRCYFDQFGNIWDAVHIGWMHDKVAIKAWRPA